MIDLLYLIPLCIVGSLVYEATHEEEMKRIFLRGVRLSAMLTGGILLLAAALLVGTVLASASSCRKADDRSDAETVAGLKAGLVEAKSEAKRQRERVDAMQCQRRRGTVGSACAIYYASTALAGDPRFPKTYADPSLYADGVVPKCPSDGTWTYDSATGRIRGCSVHELLP